MKTGKEQTGMRRDPLRALDSAAASYAPALPPIVFDMNAGSDYMQVRIDGPALRLSFCGTNDASDWRSNCDDDLVDVAGIGRAHKGFLRAWRGFERIRSRLMSYAGMPLFLEGHSRGGAIACIAAAEIGTYWGEFDGVEMLTTFGAPSPGDAALCITVEACCRHVRRYVTQTAPVPLFRDAVPHLPPGFAYDQPADPIRLFALGRPSKLHALSTYRKALAKRINKQK